MKQKLSLPLKVSLSILFPYLLFWIWFISIGLQNPDVWGEGGLLVVLVAFPASFFIINFNIFPTYNLFSTYLIFGIAGFIQYFILGYFIGLLIDGWRTRKN